MAMNQIPMLSADLIEELDKQYPRRCPDPKESEREIWMSVGMRAVVDRLLTRLEKTGEVKTTTGPAVTIGKAGVMKNNNNSNRVCVQVMDAGTHQ